MNPPPPPSLLDWLRAHWMRPTTQRLARFLSAFVALGWGAYALGQGHASGYVGLVLGIGLFFWGLSVNNTGPVLPNDLPALHLDAPQVALPHSSSGYTIAWPNLRALTALRLPGLLVLAITAQALLTDLTLFQHKNWIWGALFYALALGAFGWMLLKHDWLGPARADETPTSATLAPRWWLLLIAVVAGAYAFLAAGKNAQNFNEFRPSGVAAWLAATAAWTLAVWEGPLDPRQWWARLKGFLAAQVFTFRLSRVMVLLVIILCVGAYFRFAQLEAIPPEMTSDHVEKLLDVGDLLSGQNKIFFERNTGREPLQFYFAALVINVLNTGLTHLTLKITGAIAGLLLLPFVYLLGKEIEDENFGLLATALTAISFWATAISRVGLRFPLSPVFVAPVMFFLLRGLRRGGRNDFLLAGLFMGAGLYGYSTIRVLPLVIVAAVVWFALWQRSRARWADLALNTTLLFVTTLVVFLPLMRYATEPDNLFWYRSFSRLGSTEAEIKASPFLLLLQNYWNALRMFNWQGDTVWVNTIPTMPALDFITAALFALGALYVLFRLIARRDAVTGFLPIAILVLMLPSTLSFAFPQENPSAVRLGGAIPFVFLIAAYPLWLMVKHIRAALPSAAGAWAGAAVVVVFVGLAAQVNAQLYFVRYPPQYIGNAQNASELGKVIRGFAQSFGTYDTAYVRPYPYWVDTRAVGMYAGDFWHDFAIQAEQLAAPQADPRAKLFILHPHDQETIAELRRLYPTGNLSLYRSAWANHDFLIYLVPSATDLDESQLPAP